MSGRAVLLVLDNCEHLVNAVALLVERLISASAELRVLLTSRARLVLPFEHVYPLNGLSQDGDALSLFIQPARSAGWEEPTAAQIARMEGIYRALGGLPLAIELAAVLLSLGLQGIEQGLSNHRELLAGGSRISPRQRSMHEILDWSYRLLEPPIGRSCAECQCFARGSIPMRPAPWPDTARSRPMRSRERSRA
jgi:predicted ATPase